GHEDGASPRTREGGRGGVREQHERTRQRNERTHEQRARTARTGVVASRTVGGAVRSEGRPATGGARDGRAPGAGADVVLRTPRTARSPRGPGSPRARATHESAGVGRAGGVDEDRARPATARGATRGGPTGTGHF